LVLAIGVWNKVNGPLEEAQAGQILRLDGSLSLVRSALLVLLVLIGFVPVQAFARGTTAGTVIANQAELNFSQSGTGASVVRSNSVQFTVFEVIDVAVQALDGSSVPASSPDLQVPLTFKVTNIGNAPEAFRLERANLPAPGDFTPTPSSNGSIYLENGLQPGFQPSGPFADTRYVPGTNDLSLPPDGSGTVYLVSDFPGSLANGSVGRATLRAVSLTTGAAGSAPGKSLAGQGVAGALAIVGASSGIAEAGNSYVITGLRVVMTKTQVAVRAPNGGSELMPGAECDYLVDIQLQGTSGQIDDFSIEDPLPAVLRYVNNSLKINGVFKTDSADADEAQVINEKISIKLGRVSPSNRFLITYTTRLQ
jgi:hypothetical protein